MKLIFSANSFIYIYKLRFDIIKRLNDSNYEIVIVAGDDRFRKIICDLGFEVFTIKIQPNKKNIVADLYLVFQYLYIYSKIRPDIVFHSTIKANIYGSLATRILGIRTINNISGLGTVFFKKNFVSRLVIFLYKISQRKVDTILFQNDADLNFFIKKSICKVNQAKRIPGSGVNTAFFKKTNMSKEKEGFTFCYIGRPVKEKGILEFVRAAKLFYVIEKNVQFNIVGEFNPSNPSEISKKDLMNEISGFSAIKILGYKDDIRDIFNEIDCLVLPSYREGLSNVIMEACSMEIPVIASDVPGCNELIKDGQNGFLFNHKNINNIVQTMKKVYKLGDSDRLIMGAKGREMMVKKYDINIIKNIYGYLLEKESK